MWLSIATAAVPTLPALVLVRSEKFGTVPTVTALPGVASPSKKLVEKLKASPLVACEEEGNDIAGTPLVTEPKLPQIIQRLYEQQNIILGSSIPSQDQGFSMTDLLLLQQLPQLVKL